MRTRIDAVAVRVPSVGHVIHVTHRLSSREARIARRWDVVVVFPSSFESRCVKHNIVRVAGFPVVRVLHNAGVLLA